MESGIAIFESEVSDKSNIELVDIRQKGNEITANIIQYNDTHKRPSKYAARGFSKGGKAVISYASVNSARSQNGALFLNELDIPGQRGVFDRFLCGV